MLTVVWDDTTSQRDGQTIRDFKGMGEQYLNDKEAVVRNRNKTVNQTVEEEAGEQLAPSMGTLEEHTDKSLQCTLITTLL